MLEPCTTVNEGASGGTIGFPHDRQKGVHGETMFRLC